MNDNERLQSGCNFKTGQNKTRNPVALLHTKTARSVFPSRKKSTMRWRREQFHRRSGRNTANHILCSTGPAYRISLLYVIKSFPVVQDCGTQSWPIVQMRKGEPMRCEACRSKWRWTLQGTSPLQHVGVSASRLVRLSRCDP